MTILQHAATRAEYKRRWKAIARARKHGLDIDLIERFYLRMYQKGYNQATIRECLYYCAEQGIFGNKR